MGSFGEAPAATSYEAFTALAFATKHPELVRSINEEAAETAELHEIVTEELASGCARPLYFRM